MASIKKIKDRKFKITVSNGYRPDGRKICKAKTIVVPDNVNKRGISQCVSHAAEEIERTVKNGFCEDAEMPFEEYARRWLDRQVKYAPGTLASYRKVFRFQVACLQRACKHAAWFPLENTTTRLANTLENEYGFSSVLAKESAFPAGFPAEAVVWCGCLNRANHNRKQVDSMASIRKRGSGYLLVVSMGYDFDGKRRKPQQKTVHPPEGLTPKAKEKWLEEEAALFERQCHNEPVKVDRAITLAAYTELWLREIAPAKLAKSTLARDKQDIDRFMPFLGSYKLTDLKPEHFRNLYAELRKQKNSVTGKPLSECTVEGVHACLCGILDHAMEGGFLSHKLRA